MPTSPDPAMSGVLLYSSSAVYMATSSSETPTQQDLAMMGFIEDVQLTLYPRSFSFNLMKLVMSCDCSKAAPKELIPQTSNDPVAGLQACLAAFIVMSTDEEDRFRFAHDRYVTAADTLCEPYSKPEMHYVVASAMMKHSPYDPATDPSKVLYEQVRHVCESVEVIKRRVKKKAAYRDLLYQAAETARESGARQLGLYYFKHCLDLLADVSSQTSI